MPHPRLHHRLTGCLTAAALLALTPSLAGCTPDGDAPDDPTPTPTETASELPFDSEDEALAAAFDAYLDFLRVSDDIFHDGGAEPERIKGYATDATLDMVLRNFEERRQDGSYTTGYATAYGPVFVSSSDGPKPSVKFDVCEDVSDVGVFDHNDESLVKPDRNPLLPTTVIVHFQSKTDGLVAAQRYSENTEVCAQ